MQCPPIVCVDVGGLKADATAVDVLARLALRVQRRGYCLRLRHASEELLALVELAGLSETLPADRLRPDGREPSG